MQKYNTKESYFKYKDKFIRGIKLFGSNKPLTKENLKIVYDTISYVSGNKYYEPEKESFLHFWFGDLEDYISEYKNKEFIYYLEDTDILDYKKLDVSKNSLVIVLLNHEDLFEDFWKCYGLFDRRMFTGGVDYTLKNKFRIVVIYPKEEE